NLDQILHRPQLAAAPLPIDPKFIAVNLHQERRFHFPHKPSEPRHQSQGPKPFPKHKTHPIQIINAPVHHQPPAALRLRRPPTHRSPSPDAKTAASQCKPPAPPDCSKAPDDRWTHSPPPNPSREPRPPRDSHPPPRSRALSDYP